MHQITLSVPDISCDHCKASIEGAVGALDGVQKVEVSIEQKTVDVTTDDAAVMTDVTTAIEDQGYEIGPR